VKAVSYFLNVRYWLRDLILAIGVALAVIFFLYQPVQVEGTSMAPQLNERHRLLINKFVYKFTPISRGDIVVFYFPRDSSRSFIKRVVGLPGEWVEIRRGKVFINNQPLEESYLPPRLLDPKSYRPVFVPPGHYYVLGDRRESSHDSRQWGTLEGASIFGKAVFRYWPFHVWGSVQ
jgi:signal peptidase I